jgi:ribonuclease HI
MPTITLGTRTNNWAEFFALWMLTKLSAEQGVDQIQIMGDSKLVIDWINSKSNMQNMYLSSNMERIKELKGNLFKISFHHVYRELNVGADELSKEALSLHSGCFMSEEEEAGIQPFA